MKMLVVCLLVFWNLSAAPLVRLGVECFFDGHKVEAFKGKRVGLVTNQTGVDSEGRSSIERFSALNLVALFSPEHGLKGSGYAFENVKEGGGPKGIPVYNLHGPNRRPSEAMLKGVDVLFYDVQDIGCRSYTYTTTLFYVMEEAAKRHIPVVVLDRPNPMGGLTLDGPMLEDKWRSFIGYVDVPYCHGMTVGELAQFFNAQYKVGCDLKVIPMQGWKRSMTYQETGLAWVPTSPYIPEADTPLYYATTGILGELGIVNTGVGYTLPFKLIGAPWIQADVFAEKLNAQHLPGVRFLPFHYRPFYGLYQSKECQGVLIQITDPKLFRPVTTQYLILGILKVLYPKQILSRLNTLEEGRKNLFCKANGNADMFHLLQTEKYVAWKLIHYNKEKKEKFAAVRAPYLLYP